MKKPDYTESIAAILAGTPINAEAKRLDVNVNTLRRLLIKHPDYEKAKADGKLQSKGYAPKLAAIAQGHPAVAEVMAGSTLAAAASKYDLPATSLAVMVRKEHPGVSLRHRGMAETDVAELALKKAQKALAKAQARVSATATE